ncbi:uncharacterized protein LOC128222207 [Mya arenaria]|uniref:uncharacterized protein LOC128222207 n=1 Tax=Mya arenaria TaxID=6604 RepID=UPI0022E58300|nr:uncharacterized protein LOC128222207 [Mya arenaria]
MEETLMESITAIATEKREMEETLMESKTAIATGKLEMEETILEGKISIETGKRVIEATASEALQRLTDVSFLSNVVRTKEVTRKIKISLYGRGKKDKRKTEVEDLRIRLAKYYKKHLNSAPLSPLLSDKDERLDTFYVPPKIFEVDHRKIGAIQTEERTLVFSYRELFCKSDEFMKKVFIVGKAGMGKSSCAAMCAIKWANQFSSTDTRINNDENTSHQKTAQNNSFEDDTFYRKIDFLFHLTLRDSCKLCNLTDMIQDQLINVIYHQDERATAYQTMRTVFSNHRCVIIADGLDEWSHPNETNCGWSQADKIVPHLPPTIDATVVFTSRPCRMSQQRVKDTTIDTYLEIEGTTNIELLIQKTLDSLNKTATEKKCMFEFLGYVNRMKLERLLEVPFISMFLVCLWFEGSLKSFSLCNIYAYIIDMICARKPFPEQIEPQKYISFPQCFQHTEYVQRYYSTVMEMAKLAFTTLFSNDQTSPLLFRKIDGLSHVNLVFLLKSGILNETKTASSIRKSSSYSFIDKTVQEFLAAIYMSHHPKEIDRVVKPFYLKSGDTSAVSQVFIFLCGLNIESANEMSAMISKSIFTYNDGIIVDVDETRTQCTITPSYKSMYNDDLHKAKVNFLQSIICSGYKEAKESQVQDIQLSMFCLNYTNNTDAKIFHNLLRINPSTVLDDNIEFGQSEDESLCAYTGKFEQFDLSTCNNLKYLSLCGYDICGVPVHTNNLVTLQLSFVSNRIECRMMQLLQHRSQNLRHLKLDTFVNVDSLCKTLPRLEYLETLMIRNTFINDYDLLPSTSVVIVRLEEVMMTARSLARLVEWQARSTHNVSCMLEYCSVDPKPEYEEIKQCVQKRKHCYCNISEYYFHFGKITQK